MNEGKRYGRRYCRCWNGIEVAAEYSFTPEKKREGFPRHLPYAMVTVGLETDAAGTLPPEALRSTIRPGAGRPRRLA